jgi:hypothetical protein
MRWWQTMLRVKAKKTSIKNNKKKKIWKPGVGLADMLDELFYVRRIMRRIGSEQHKKA